MIRSIRHRLTAVLAGLALAMLAASLPQAAQAADVTVNDTARYLAGLPPSPDSPLARWTGDGGWQQHASAFNVAWSRFERAQLAPIRKWSAKNIENPRPTLYYMFSGPDFLYADAFFPGALTYILAGLEPVGPLPVVNEGNRRNLGRLRSALSSVLNFSFFRTRDMRSDFSGGTFSGTLPILYIFLARSGKTVHEAGLIRLEASGEAVAADATPLARGQPTGARIVFSGDDGEKRTLYYFSADVSNGGPYHQALLEFCRRQGSGDAFVKSASYLMHSDSFANVRNFLLDNAQLILQDDSGIPVRYFQPADWVLEPHGRYLGPIGLFAGRGQAQLGELFRRGNPEQLDFGVGYRFRQNESNLLLALRKPAP